MHHWHERPDFSVPSHMDLSDLKGSFASPPAQFRGAPFWAWNGRLRQEELLRQIHVMNQMGLGGFFMHSRTGLVTEYLGDEWHELTKACADEADRLGMHAWLYDEDRWPSGTAGGMVTENPDFRAQFVSLEAMESEEFSWDDEILAAFACDLSGVAFRNCERLAPGTTPDEYSSKAVLVFRIEEAPESTFFNGNTDVDRLKREATDTFIEMTHEQYRRRCGDRFGDSIYGVFTDEPHRQHVMSGFGSGSTGDIRSAPWTDALPEEFKTRFGYDLVERLPELFLQPDGQKVSQVKWHYVELLQELFVENFAEPIYDWCTDNDLYLTGHVLQEDSLTAQTAMHGSLMRFYEYMHIPGVDVLTEGNRNYWLAKQLASVGRQLGRPWLLSELYGCTGWQMSFESHKAVGDWQALFGVNLRCHHLSWYSMEGEAKRDYPASILHQSGWWSDYHYVESYFARLGLMLMQGEPACDVLVLNPVESVWCQIYPGYAEGLSAKDDDVQELEQAHRDIFFWLAGSQIDFDYADEEMLGRIGSVAQDRDGGAVLRVGEAEYRCVVIGRMTTIRSSSLELLRQFVQAGGEVLFVGDPPQYVDALASDAAQGLAEQATLLPWDRGELVAHCKPLLRQPVEIIDQQTGEHIDDVFCQLRRDDDRLIVAALNVNPEQGVEGARIRIAGSGYVSEWDCLTGERRSVAATAADGWLEVDADFVPSGEHVYVVTPEPDDAPEPIVRDVTRRVACEGPFEYELTEPNVCVLDFAKYRIDGGEWHDQLEILKVDRAVREAFDLPPRGGQMVQPWFRDKYGPEPQVKGQVELSFEFDVAQIPDDPLYLCMERPELFDVSLNGKKLDARDSADWWIDTAFKKVRVPAGDIKPGTNRVTLKVAFREDIEFEALYLIGEFGVQIDGTKRLLVALPPRLEAGNITTQGLPFYSGSVVYRVPVAEAKDAGSAAVLEVPGFEGACVKVRSENMSEQIIPWQPYEADVTGAAAKDEVLQVEVVLTRRNTFGPLHQVPLETAGYGPGNFVGEGDAFSEDYMLYPAGLLAPPQLRLETPQ